MTKKEKKIEKRDLNTQELKEIRSMTEFVNGEIWKQSLIANNTALIKDGILLSKQLEDVNKVLVSAKEVFVSRILLDCGVPEGQPVNFNLETGAIVEVKIDKKVKK